MSKIGLNIAMGAIRYEDRLLRILRGMDSTFHLLMTGDNEPGKERAGIIGFITRINHPRSHYVHRLYATSEDWQDFSPESFRLLLKEMHPDNQIVTQVRPNEPSGSERKEFIANQVQMLRYAQELGHRVSLGVIGVGGPDERAIMAGTFDPLLRAIHEANQKKPGSAYLDKHEYAWLGWAECGAGFDDIPYQAYLEPRTLRQKIKTAAEWNIREGRWLVRTSDWEAVRCQQIGIDIVPMLFTEAGPDGVGDPIEKLNAWQVRVRDLPDGIAQEFGINKRQNPDMLLDQWGQRLKNKYGMRGTNLRGIGTLRKYYDAVFWDWPQTGRYAAAVQWVLAHWNNDVYWPPHIKGAMLFTWNYSGEWGGENNTSGHNYGEEGLDDVLIAVGQLPDSVYPPAPTPTPIPELPPVPEPTPEPVPLTTRWIRSTNKGGSTNIRLNPDTNSAGVGLLQSDWLQAQVSVRPLSGADYGVSDQWYEVQTATVRGFVAAAYVEIRDLSPVPDSIQITFPVDYGDIDALIDILRRQIEQLELAKEGRLASQIATAVYAASDRFPDTDAG